MELDFSQRLGLRSIRTELQLGAMDSDLRVALWNDFFGVYLESAPNLLRDDPDRDLFRSIWARFLGQHLDDLPPYAITFRDWMRAWFDSIEWHRIYALVEFVCTTDQSERRDMFRYRCLASMKMHASGYRFVGDRIVPITDDIELSEIELGLRGTEEAQLAGANTHLDAALGLLSDRLAPDYRNSIKESISAVESLVKIIAGDDNLTAGQALSRIGAKRILELNPVLRQALEKLYAYTNDEQGIRHALLDEPGVDFPEAKFMLVVASAAVNLLILESGKAGVSLACQSPPDQRHA